MIAMDDARRKVDERLTRIVEGDQAVLGLSAVVFTCSGTDVRGPDLEQEIELCAAEFLKRIFGGADAVECLNGAVLRTFWLGYELGREQD